MKGDRRKKEADGIIKHVENLIGSKLTAKEALSDMKKAETILLKELEKAFAVKLNIHKYENLSVYKMSHLGQVTIKSPTMLTINFAHNPSAIKAASIALQKSSLKITPQQEGAVLYIPIVRMSRERREEIVEHARTKIMNEYRKKLNDAYGKHAKKTRDMINKAKAENIHDQLLDLKRAFETRGLCHLDEKERAFLEELV
ncbi:Protein MRRF-1 [Aphelenchoides avenae]|nr:Protein MRRF-1 [Aphelenchus avenae]